jgi:hypothetical protein
MNIESQPKVKPMDTVQKVSRLVGSGSKLEQPVRIGQEFVGDVLKELQTVSLQSFGPNLTNSSTRLDPYHSNNDHGACGDGKLQSVSPDDSFQSPQSGVKDANAAHHRSDVMDVDPGGGGQRQPRDVDHDRQVQEEAQSEQKRREEPVGFVEPSLQVLVSARDLQLVENREVDVDGEQDNRNHCRDEEPIGGTEPVHIRRYCQKGESRDVAGTSGEAGGQALVVLTWRPATPRSETLSFSCCPSGTRLLSSVWYRNNRSRCRSWRSGPAWCKRGCSRTTRTRCSGSFWTLGAVPWSRSRKS